jgi:4-diphosphocytidyl-2-C-methyl-D-erythritol kinase
MVVFPNAKINLGLYVTEKRPDGFHNIETVFIPVKGFNDILEVILNNDNKKNVFTTSGLLTDAKQEDNLVIKALNLIREYHNIPPLKIHLHKVIPPGAGLGGGSSDAAFMLRLLNEQFKLAISPNKLEEMAATLGADCAFFIRNAPTMAKGIGNEFSPVEVSLGDTWLTVVVPPIHLSTPEAYRNINPQKPQNSLEEILKMEKEKWHKLLLNDFEPRALGNHQTLQQIKEILYRKGALYAAMSGSGSAFFGLFKDKPQINWPDNYTVWKGACGSSGF